MGGEYVLPRRQGLEAALLAAIPQRAAPLADFTAAHRVAARTRQARARAVEGGGGEEAATTAAACPLYEGAAFGHGRVASCLSAPLSQLHTFFDLVVLALGLASWLMVVQILTASLRGLQKSEPARF